MTVTISVSHRTGDMHLFLIIVAAIIVANWVLTRNSNGCGCLILILVLLALGAIVSHH